MILPDFILSSRQNKIWTNIGLDSLEKCANKEAFKNYPHSITYDFNSRGFRDDEWPTTLPELQDSVWCLGGNQTLGTGVPLEHTLVRVLQAKTNMHCINISLDGASNEWLSRKAIQILNTINPTVIIIDWKTPINVELSNAALADELRQKINYFMPIEEQLLRLAHDIMLVEITKQNSQIIHIFGPQLQALVDPTNYIKTLWNVMRGSSWCHNAPTTLSSLVQLDNTIQSELRQQNLFNLIEDAIKIQEIPEMKALHAIFSSITHIKQPFLSLDVGRDSVHYDILTTSKLVEDIMKLIKL